VIDDLVLDVAERVAVLETQEDEFLELNQAHGSAPPVGARAEGRRPSSVA
jgi:hypothetical protein